MTDRKADLLFITPLCLAFIVFTLLLYFDFKEAINQKIKTEQIASITFKQNRVERKFTAQVLWGSIDNNEALYNYDSVRTESGAEATISLNDGIQIGLSDNTLVMMSFDDQQWQLSLDEGDLFLSTENREQTSAEPSPIIIESSVGKLVLNHGSLQLSERESGEKTVHLIKGALCIEDDSGQTFLDENTVLVQNSDGERSLITYPFQNIHPESSDLFFIATEQEDIFFSWQSIAQDPEYLDISEKKDFSDQFKSISVKDRNSILLSLYEGHFYWRLRTEDNAGSVSSFKIIKDSTLSPSRPLDDAVFYYVSQMPFIQLQWDPSHYASDYKIEIYESVDLQNPVLNLSSQTADIAFDTLGEGEYSWHVRALYNCGEGSEITGDFSSFSIEKQKTLAPVTIENGENTRSASFSRQSIKQREGTLYWESLNEADSYKVEFSGNQDFSDIKKELITSNHYVNIPEETLSGDYFWRVTAFSGDQASEPSEIQSLCIEEYDVPKITFPENGAFYHQNQPAMVYRWDGQNRGSSYFVELSDDPDFQNIIFSGFSGNNQINGDILKTGEYYIRVAFLDQKGAVLVSSQAVNFTVYSMADASELESPQETSLLEQEPLDEIYFSWESIEDADYYSIEISSQIMGRDIELFAGEVDEAHYLFHDVDRLKGSQYSWSVKGYKKNGSSDIPISRIAQGEFYLKPPLDSLESEALEQEIEVKKNVKEPVIQSVIPQEDLPLPVDLLIPVEQVVENPLSIPVLRFPLMEEKLDMSYLDDIIFKWDTVDDADFYIFTIKQTAEGTSVQIYSEQVEKSQLIFNQLRKLQESEYQWSVQAWKTSPNGSELVSQKANSSFFIYLSKTLVLPDIEISVVEQ